MTIATPEQGAALALEAGQVEFTNHQRAALAQLGVEKATNADLAVYMHVCQRTGLDPFARQIYMIERKGKQTIQTGIDGYRLVARRSVDRSGEPLTIESALWCGQDGAWTEVWLADGPPAAAKVTVRRGDGTFSAVALWREYVQTFYKDGKEQVTQMWRSRPAGQLAKCAEALALRKAFPQDLSGIYVDAELDRADVVQGETVRPSSPLDAALAAEQTSDPGTPDPKDPVDADVVPEDFTADPVTTRTRNRMFALFGKKGIPEADQLSGINHLTGKQYTSRGDLTEVDARIVIERLTQMPDAVVGTGAES